MPTLSRYDLLHLLYSLDSPPNDEASAEELRAVLRRIYAVLKDCQPTEVISVR